MSRRISIWIMLAACAAATLTSWIDWSWAPRMAATLLLAAGCFWLLSRRDRGVERIDRAVWLLLAIPIWGVLQLLLGRSVYANASLQAIAYWSSLALVFWTATVNFADKQSRHLMLTCIGILASFLAWVALLQPYAGRLGLESMRSAAADAYAASFSNRNMYACFAELSLPVLLWLGLSNGRLRWYWLVNAAALAGSVINTGSRGGASLIVIECIVFAIVIRGSQNPYWKLAFGSAVLTIVVAAATLGDGGLAVRMQYSDPMVMRREIYQSSMAMFIDRPLAGFGLGTFSAVYPAYALFDNGRFVNLAHNDWLQLSAEGGLVALGLFACFCALVLGGFRQSIWALGVPIVLLHALFDFPLHRAGVAAWWMVLAGTLRSRPLSPPDESSPVP
ncbi:MAG TPA: O-antigen ligase family protein [Bryobacteraceae bacterium]|nr:O-antigen ligase family protein [Bryobacteraceae bacterium]